jgi:TRAP-type C4-dicarboxylate transport system substrate-binding protein
MYAEDLNKRFKEATDGLISLKIFPGESIGSSAAMLDMIKVGTLDMFHHNFSTFGNFYAPIGVFNAPYLTYDVAQLYRATNNSSPILQRLNEGLVKEGGVRIIGAWLNGTREVCCKFPAYKPTDLNGHMFRSLPNDLWNAMVAGLGGTPTPIENAEVVSSLMTNVVEATEQTIEGIHKNSYWEVADYILLTDHLMFSLAVGINEKSWQKISPENQKKILTIMDDMNKEYTTEIIPDREAGLLQKIKEAGMKVIDDTNGLDKDAFRKSVLAEVDKKYPDWTPMIKEIQGM